MSMSAERFKDGYANFRRNPFTDADMSVDKIEGETPGSLTAPGSSPFCLQLLELPRKNTPSTVSVYCYTDELYFTEVVTAPTQGQFRVDYPSPDGEGTGLIEFNQNDAGKSIKVSYKATGSPVAAEFFDSKVSYPAGSPGSNQHVIFKSGVPTWAYNPVRYFHEGPVIYHASGESESCFLFRFKKDTNQSKALLELKGAKLWQGFYTELKEHLHAVGTLGTAEDAGGHSHTVNSHGHGVGTLYVSEVDDHQHLYDSGPDAALLTSPSGSYIQHTISGSTENASPGTNAIGNHSHGMVGATATAGTTPKTYPDSLKVYIDSVDRTAALLALSGLDKFGNGTDTHAFVTTGSGEMDITSYLAGGTFHDVKITEPISAKGGRALLCLEVY